MGWVGCYDAMVYCDSCNDYAGVAQVKTGEECRQMLRVDGWRFRKDGAVLCPDCAHNPASELMPEDKREGNAWQLRWPMYDPRTDKKSPKR